MLNFVKIVYLYKELIGKCTASRFDTAEWGFPFTEEEITGGYGLNYSSPFGPRHIPESSNTFHGGIDIGVGSGASAGDPGSNKGVPIHAARDGVVTAVYGIDGNGGGNRVYLQHDNGWTSWYMHMVRTAATVGQKVSRGEVIGYTGGSGSSGQGAYDEHLHFEIHQPGEVKIDPASCYNGLSRVFKNQLDA
jgi:murein DD-endopeptidase MepM/ murein hydrolase activator NlpD